MPPDPLDMSRLTQPQRDALGAIACGQDQGHNSLTLRALERRGLIEPVEVIRLGEPPVIRWDVPIPVHAAWTRWCAEQPDSSDTPGDAA